MLPFRPHIPRPPGSGLISNLISTAPPNTRTQIQRSPLNHRIGSSTTSASTSAYTRSMTIHNIRFGSPWPPSPPRATISVANTPKAVELKKNPLTHFQRHLSQPQARTLPSNRATQIQIPGGGGGPRRWNSGTSGRRITLDFPSPPKSQLSILRTTTPDPTPLTKARIQFLVSQFTQPSKARGFSTSAKTSRYRGNVFDKTIAGSSGIRFPSNQAQVFPLAGSRTRSNDFLKEWAIAIGGAANNKPIRENQILFLIYFSPPRKWPFTGPELAAAADYDQMANKLANKQSKDHLQPINAREAIARASEWWESDPRLVELYAAGLSIAWGVVSLGVAVLVLST
ncbi:hypothetical protein DFH27DRAFT_605174 [Peziza echinospora]|nr:hypothetical protein DFH27DRAFT_605174 [Peziza echinospora]